jgi:hypothetical protein
MLKAAGAIVVASLAATVPAASGDAPYAFTCPIVRPPPARHALGAVPADFLALLGVMRRPQEPADALDPWALGPVARIVFDDTSRFLAAGPSGDRYFVVAGKPSVVIFRPSCVRRAPPNARRAMRRFVHSERLDARSTRLFLVRRGTESSGAGGALDAATIRDGTALGGSYTASRAGLFTLDGLVPDGVASVVVEMKRGDPVTAPVVNNHFIADLPVRPPAPPALRAITWLAADGSVVKRRDWLVVFGSVSAGSR